MPWAEIGLGDKLQVLWDLCEWHMADPERFRGLVNEGGAVDVEIAWVSRTSVSATRQPLPPPCICTC